jgi:DNA polymerase-3 subunit gamma/tau
MTASSSLYRKYRSQSFEELVGQEPVVRTLKNAIASGRVSHAYLFTGPRGVGKTSAARLLARAANCTSEGEDKPCNECPNCLAATRDIATDLIEIDAASNTGVDNIREVIERANFAPSIWNTKFYIVDEVHMLSTSAFNALLKTLEEPPAHTSFILATTEVHKVPATVASRCQRFDFRRIPLKAMVERLQFICEEEGIEAEPAALELVAQQSTGSLRDALSLMDQLRVFAEKAITLQSVQDLLGAGGSEEVAAFVDSLLDRDLASGLRRINKVMEEGVDLRQFNRQMVEHLRDLMLVKSGAAASSGVLLDVTDEMRSRLHGQAARASMGDLLNWMKIFGEADTALRSTVYGQLPLEMAFVAATLPAETVPAAAAKDHSEELGAGIAQIGAVPPERPAPQKRVEPAIPRNNAPPPPIHSELGSLGSNGHAAPPTPPKIVPPTEVTEDEVADAAPISDEVPQAAPAAAGAGDFERLVERWSDVLDQMKARNPKMATFFRNGDLVRVQSLSNGLCTIAFRDPFHAKLMQDPQRRETAEVAISRVLGYTCRVESITFEQADKGLFDAGRPQSNGGNGRNKTKEKPSPYETSRGKAAINIFGIEKFEDNE